MTLLEHDAKDDDPIAALNDRLRTSTCDGLGHERAILTDAYRRVATLAQTTSRNSHANVASSTSSGKSELIWIRGATGTPKEQLLAKFFAPLVLEDEGCCIVGKFDQQIASQQKPHAAFVQACGMFIEQINDTKQQQQRKQQFGEALSKLDGIDLPLKLIPALAPLLPPLETSVEKGQRDEPFADVKYLSHSSREAANRFKHVFRLLLRTIAENLHGGPLIFILQHVHWVTRRRSTCCNYASAMSLCTAFYL